MFLTSIPNDHGHLKQPKMLSKSSVLFFFFGGIVTACLFTTVSRILPILLEGRLRQMYLPGIESLRKLDIGLINGQYGIGRVQEITGKDARYGKETWPITVKADKDFLRPDFKSDVLAAEVLAALHQAIEAKIKGKKEKAHKLFQHSLALDPDHADTLNEYGRFIEDDDIVKADHLYTCALINNASHTEAVANLKRTSGIVEEIDQRMLNRIEDKRTVLVRLPENNAAFQRARQEMYYLHVYHTTAIEGNTLSLEQMRSILETGVAVPGKSIMEHNEVIGLNSALQYINTTLMNRIGGIQVQDILEIHRRVLGYVDPIEAGHIRTTQVFVGSHIPPSPGSVEPLLENFVAWMNSDEMQSLHPVEFAALAHYKLVYIHPFMDGNGRTSRLLMNMILMRAGFPPVIIKVSDRHEYYDALKMANKGDVRPFIRFIAMCTERMLDAYLWLTSDGHSVRELDDGRKIIVDHG